MTEIELEDILSKPSPRLVEDIKKISGDFMILGLGGKMGPSLAKLLKRSLDKVGSDQKIYGASRFSNKELYQELTDFGIECHRVDLLNDQQLQTLPNVENVIYMAGNKFGTSGNEHFTWAMNSYLPGRVAEKYSNSRIIVFSTGNVYPFMAIDGGGATEEIRPSPVGEYAQSCLGRERIFEHFSVANQTPMLIFRLNYALDLRYGVLLEVAKSVKNGLPLNLEMGYANVIWQGDANEYAIRSLLLCESPARFLNITGPETISIESLAEKFGELFNCRPIFENESAKTALLNNAQRSFDLFGEPHVSLDQMVSWTADWLNSGGKELGKATHFQERKGDF